MSKWGEHMVLVVEGRRIWSLHRIMNGIFVKKRVSYMHIFFFFAPMIKPVQSG